MDGQAAMALTEGAVRMGARRRVPKDYQEAFVETYRSYYPKIFAYVYSRIGNVEVAKDLVAEVFEKAYVKGHTVREPAAYVTWLFTVAKRVVVGNHRRLERESKGMGRMKESLRLSEQRSDPEDYALRNEAVSNLMRHMRRLSQRDQDLLALKFEGELNYTEIGRVLKMSNVNVRVSIFRALKRLRTMIEEERLDAAARAAGGSAAALIGGPQRRRPEPPRWRARAHAPQRAREQRFASSPPRLSLGVASGCAYVRRAP